MRVLHPCSLHYSYVFLVIGLANGIRLVGAMEIRNCIKKQRNCIRFVFGLWIQSRYSRPAATKNRNCQNQCKRQGNHYNWTPRRCSENSNGSHPVSFTFILRTTDLKGLTNLICFRRTFAIANISNKGLFIHKMEKLLSLQAELCHLWYVLARCNCICWPLFNLLKQSNNIRHSRYFARWLPQIVALICGKHRFLPQLYPRAIAISRSRQGRMLKKRNR